MTSPTLLGSVFDTYTATDHLIDEMVDGSRRRAHWHAYAEGMDRLGFEEFSGRWNEALQMIHENGVTYNIHGDPRGLDRPWRLDPIPFIISVEESRKLELGLMQRARLLEAILVDLYGPQRSLFTGLIPPKFIFANPAFLRPCHGLKVPGERYLHLVAFDVGRDAHGKVVVLSDRTQAPSGAGYALENRIVMARMLPELFKVCKVQRLAMFFATLRDSLRNLAPHNRDNPRTVLLTPGPLNETYFEHAYLARYLGYTLVEGGDLTVRDNRVYLKLLDGLQPVDVIWRRLDDDYCDPLELRADSFLGVPGLVHAVRSGNVIVANALGSGLAESAGLVPFLPTLCRELLGEDLIIPSAPAYWCGDPKSCDHVLTNFTNMVIKPAYRSIRMEPVFGETLSRDHRQHWIQRIRAKPWQYVGQERQALSTAPVLNGQTIEPRKLVLRTYLAAIPQSPGFTCMPGGLTRVTADVDTMIVSLQKGGGSKDTWVLTEGTVNEFSLLPSSSRPVVLSRGGNDLPSRAADNLFWLGRYVERAEDLIRMVRGILVRIAERPGFTEAPEMPTLLRALTHLTQTHPGFVGEGAEARLAAPEAELLSVIFETERVGSLAFNLRSVHRVASATRDRMSLDMWRVLSHLQQTRNLVADRTDPPTLSEVLDELNSAVLALSAFGGIAMESMTRGHGWRFLEMGRKIERAMHLIRLTRHTLTASIPQETALLEALLDIADSSMTYRRRYLGSLNAAAVLDLLLMDETNPRSLAYQLNSLRENVEALPRPMDKAGRTLEQKIILSVLSNVQLADIEKLAKASEHGVRPALEDFLHRLEKELPRFSDSVAHHYLSHLQTTRQLAGMGE